MAIREQSAVRKTESDANEGATPTSNSSARPRLEDVTARRTKDSPDTVADAPAAVGSRWARLGRRQKIFAGLGAVAAITLAAIYQRADQINSAGGYLRSLTDRARDGKFSAWPMVMALLRAKLDAEKTAAQTRGGPPDDGDKTEGRLEVSDALLRSLRRPKS